MEIKDVRVETKKTAANGDMDTEKVGSRAMWIGTRGGRGKLTPRVLFLLACVFVYVVDVVVVVASVGVLLRLLLLAFLLLLFDTTVTCHSSAGCRSNCYLHTFDTVGKFFALEPSLADMESLPSGLIWSS